MFRSPVFRIFILVIVIVLMFLTLKSSIFAADPGRSFSITPPIFELKANPGDHLSEVVSIFNNGENDIGIAASVENLRPMGEKGQVQVIGESDEGLPSLREWLKIKETSFTLAKGATKNVTFTIDVPANAEPGGHFVSVLFGATGTNLEGIGSQISQKIGTLVLLTVAGVAKEQASVANFQPKEKFYWNNQTISFNLLIKNSGNVYVRPRGFLTITDIFGRKISQTEIDGKNILPTASREIPAEFKSKRLFGPYTASLALVYGNSNQNINASCGFWVIPWIPTLAVTLALVLIIIFRRRLWRAILVLFGRG